MRMETRVGPKTRIEVVTEGVLTRMLHSDPALTIQARELFRPELRILVMSATLEGAPVAGLLGGGAGRGGPRADVSG